MEKNLATRLADILNGSEKSHLAICSVVKELKDGKLLDAPSVSVLTDKKFTSNLPLLHTLVHRTENFIDLVLQDEIMSRASAIFMMEEMLKSGATVDLPAQVRGGKMYTPLEMSIFRNPLTFCENSPHPNQDEGVEVLAKILIAAGAEFAPMFERTYKVGKETFSCLDFIMSKRPPQKTHIFFQELKKVHDAQKSKKHLSSEVSWIKEKKLLSAKTKKYL